MNTFQSIKLDDVMAALRQVKDPVTGRDVMSAGLIHDLKIEGAAVMLRLSIRPAAVAMKAELESEVRKSLIEKAGATQVHIKVESETPKSQIKQDKMGVPGVRRVVAVSSGKGGVGKSTVAVNLAVALARQGLAVGLLDTDIYGPNVPTMMGVADQAPSARQDDERGELILPVEAHGVKIMSMGVIARGDQPAVWRGPMLHSVISQFLMKVDWGKLDYLIVDMPPGTGDVQLSLTQLVSLAGAVIVTTPQEVACQDVRKAILMFEKVGVSILGVVENMSYFICDSCDKRHEIFGSGGGKTLAEKYHTTLLAQVPMGAAVRVGGDTGAPVVVSDPKSQQAQALARVAMLVDAEIERKALASGVDSGAPEIKIGEF